MIYLKDPIADKLIFLYNKLVFVWFFFTRRFGI